MNKTINILETGANLADISEEMSKTKKPGTLKVTKGRKPVLAIMPWNLYEGLIETLEILSDKEFMVSLREGIKEADEGKGIPWDKAKKELGL